MRTKSPYVFFFTTLISLFLSLSLTRIGFCQENIIRIDIEGSRRIETDLIRINLSAKVGDPLSQETVSNDIKKIYKLGFFDDVSAEVEKTPEGVILIYNVKEKPVVVDLRVKGNKKIKTDEILKVIEVKEGRIIELEKVKMSAAAIKKLYLDKGYVAAEVNYDIEPKTEGTVGVTFDIKEGKKAFIKEVIIVGNKALKTKKIKGVMQTKPKWFLTFITQRGIYRQEESDRDSERIRALYLDSGYIDVKVSKPEVQYSEEKEGFVVTYRIEEGNQYQVKEIKVEGDLVASEDELMKLLTLQIGKPFSRAAIADDISRLTTFYGDKGYAFANVDPDFKIDRKNLTVDISFKIEKGKEIYIRNIDIAGNIRTRDKVIRREIPIQEQQLFSSSRIQAIKPRIFRLGYFEENIEVSTDRVPDTEDQLDINVKLKEKPTGFFSIAGGFSSVETFIFAGQIQESNLFGYGRNLSLSAQIGGVTRLFLLNYTDPHFLDSDWTLDVLGFQTDREFQDFSRFSFGGSVTLGRRLLRDLTGRITYRLEHVDVDNVSEDAFLLISETPRLISSVGIGFVWDTRNNVLDATSGNISRTIVEFAGGPFGGNTDFIRYTASTRFFFPFYLNTVFSVAARYGLIDFRNLGNELLVSERFFLGGPNDLRGYEFRRVGPRVPTDDGGFVIIGGVQEVFFTAEYIFPLIPQVGFKGVVFFDMGNAFNDGQNLSIDPRDLRKDYGFGIRWVSPLGPLRFEIGFPIGDTLPGEDPYEVQFTVGTLY
ncbi:MAG: outer membrane protein assembly complex protein YaeT, outer membrane protein [Candidatus Dadabacteria bacterium CSP1-2]|nr:MAG: outer membrane protein assembly complex protein YaeT, outer membrane protein [Candidatus Dadabacteria bacterium CSP1-2]